MPITDLVRLDEDGYFYADYPTFRQYFVDEYLGVYGADTYLEDDSQDGQWISILAQAAYDLAAQGSSTVNSFAPSGAQGIGLSRQVKLNGIQRQEPSYSTATVAIGGVNGTVITNGVVQDTLGQKWNLPASVTIPGAGTINVTATAQEIGAITADASTITTIFTPTQGWQTVTNAAAATPGAAVESDATLRIRQARSVATPAQTVFEATVGAVQNVDGVTKMRGYENDSTSTDLNGIPAHSICMVVAGGDDVEIAEAIMSRKTPGTGTYGDVTETVEDANGVENDISFQRAVTATINVEVTVDIGSGWSADYIPLIQEAVAAEINSTQIGQTLLLTKLYLPAYLNGNPISQTFDVTLIEMEKDGGGLAEANITLDFDENPVCDPDTDVTVNLV